MDEDFSKAKPFASEKEREYHFIRQFNDILKMSLLRTSLLESLSGRSKRMIREGLLGFAMQSLLFMPGNLSSSPLWKTINYELNLTKDQNMFWLLFNGIHHRLINRPWQDATAYFGDDMKISNTWREKYFSERYDEELKKSHYLRNRALLLGNPGVIIISYTGGQRS